MKKLLLLALSLMMVGCVESEQKQKITMDIHKDGYSITIIDSCEYVVSNPSGIVGALRYSHKGNCRFCKERRQKELEELVIKLKEK